MIRFYIGILLISLYGCSNPKELSYNALQSYILDEESGLHHSIDVDGSMVSVTYKPTDLWVSQEIGESAMDDPTIDSLRLKFSPYHYFILSLSRENKEALSQFTGGNGYSDLVQTMSFRMHDFVNLTTSKQDTIPVSDFALNRTYGLSPATDIVFVFERDKVSGNWIQFNLNEFGMGLGNRSFRFSVEDLEQSPLLNFKKL